MKKQLSANVSTVFKHHYNSIPSKGEFNRQPSMTVPNQSMSVAEMIDRHNAGLPIQGSANPMYYGEIDFPDFSKMDLIDLQEFKEATQMRIQELRQKRQELKREIDEKYNKNELRKLQERIKLLSADQRSEVLGKIPTNADQGNKAQEGPKP